MPLEKINKRIRRLPMELANKIAAGEVVERPASVLKELLENSIDAGSTQIDVVIEASGIGLIKVQDNGCGICKDDLELALFQHATSKILSFSDLEEVGSYGFRGEALASISAVSRLTLKSYVEGQASGWSIQRQGRSEETILLPMPRTLGTTVEVRDLFYNTPARRKFLRSEKTELLYIEEVFKKIALSQPNICFSFKIGDRVQKRLNICRTIEAETRRIAELCGQSFIQSAHYMEADNNGFKLRGWLGSKSQARSQADLQFFYVNGRIVKDKVVSHAIRQAYPEFAKLGKYPSYILFFDINPASVDVNVHPTKHEVRFREARTVHAFLLYSIAKALSQTEVESDIVSEVKSITPNLTTETIELMMETIDSSPSQTSLKKEPNIYSAQAISRPLKSLSDESVHSVASQYLEPNSSSPNSRLIICKPLTLLNHELLIGENDEGLVIVDIRSLKQQFIQTTLKNDLKKEAAIPFRLLLMPVRIPITKIELIEKNENNLHQLGFQWTQLGPDSILVRAVPKIIKTISDQFENLFKILLHSLTIEIFIESIANYVIDSEQSEMTLERSNELLKIVQTTEEFFDVHAHIKIFKPEQLKTL